MLPYLAFALLVLGTKLILIARVATTTPFWDQWDAVAQSMLLPWVHHEWHWSNLLLPQNEHHIVPTRVLELLLFVLNNSIWNPMLEMTVDAVLHVAALTLFIAGVSRLVPAPVRLPLLFFAALFFCLPLGSENTLWGFQSQFYFLLLFSIGFLWAIACARQLSAPWWLGMGSGVLATMSLASGLVALVAGAMVLGLQLQQNHGRRWLTGLLMILCLGGALLAYLAIPVLHTGAGARYHPTVADVFTCFNAILSWPFPVFSNAAELVLLCLALCYLLIRPSDNLIVRALVPATVIFFLLRLFLPSTLPDATAILILPVVFFVFRLLATDSGQNPVGLPLAASAWLLLTANWADWSMRPAFIVYLPLWLFCMQQLSAPPPPRDARWLALAFGIWLAGQVLCISDGRALGYTASRYRDIYVPGLVLNAALLLSWRAGTPELPLRSRLLPWVWVITLLIGSKGLPLLCENEIMDKMHTNQRETANVSAYLHDGQRSWLQKTPYQDIPLDSPSRLQSLLDQPAMRAMLPPELIPANAPREAPWVRNLLASLFEIGVGAISMALLIAFWLLLGNRTMRGIPRQTPLEVR
jgi:hypothetical protein